MWKKIAIAGAVGAAILGTGAAALAETGSNEGPSATLVAATSAPTAGTATKAGPLKGKLALALKRFDHGSWVTTGKNGSVTHDAIKGAVTAVSPSSISVKAGDGTTETFTVTASTAVRIKGTSGKSSIAAVKVNDTVLVTGTKSGSTDTAVHVLDGGAK
jgi:hypothetical protein